MLNDVRAVAFDLDNTLWDVEPVLARAEARLLEWLHEHCPRIPQQVSQADMATARAQLAREQPHLAARCEVEILPDVRPALARLRHRFRLASLSNGNADLARIGLDSAFSVSLNARQIGAGKPDRRCFERLAQELAVMPREILYVGDDPWLDVHAAREAGCRSAWMNRRAGLWPAEIAPADVSVRECGELAALLGA